MLRVFPPATTILPLYLMVKSMRLYDTHIGLILVFAALGIPLVVWIMRSFFQEVPSEIEDAARVDGCSPLSVFWRVTLPLCIPGFFATGVLSFMFLWNSFLCPLILTASQAKTAPVVISTYYEDHVIAWGKMSSAGVLTTLPVIVFGLMVKRYLVKGLSLGGVKG